MMIEEELAVSLNSTPVGSLARLDGDRILFEFDHGYVVDANRPVLSLSFLDNDGGVSVKQRTTRRRASPFFANVLPEGHMRSYIASRAGVNETRDFPLLRVVGDDLPGAVRVVPVRPIPQLDGDGETADGSRTAESAPLRFSLAGVQLKFSAVAKADGGLTIPAHGMGGDWILKLPSARYDHVPENEFSMMSLASMTGIDTPAIKLVPLESVEGVPCDMTDGLKGRNVLAVKRFDRSSRDPWRIHIEDFAQIFGKYPDRKYEGVSYANIGQIVVSFAKADDIDQFIGRLAFSALIGNGDMHLKNWSLMYPDERTPKMAPVYDMLSTTAYIPDETMALRLGRTKRWDELTFDEFSRLADAMRCSENMVLNRVVETVGKFREAWETERRHLPVAAGVASAIDRQLSIVPIAGVMSMRGRVRRRRKPRKARMVSPP